MNTSIREYRHEVLRDALGTFPDASAGLEHLADSFRHTFPIRVLLALTPHPPGLTRAVHLVVAARLRAKGYRLRIVVAHEDPLARATYLEGVRRFFTSLGESNLELMESSLKFDVGRRTWDVTAADPCLLDRIECVATDPPRIAIPTPGEHGWLPPHTPWGQYLNLSIVRAFSSITAFDRPFLPQPVNSTSTASDREAHRWNLEQLCREVESRISYTVVPPVRDLDLSVLPCRELLQELGPGLLWKHLRGELDGGTLDVLARVFDGDELTTLRALRALVEIGLVERAGDRFLAARLTSRPEPSTASSRSVEDAAPETTWREKIMLASIRKPQNRVVMSSSPGVSGERGRCDTGAEIQREELRISVLFPPGVFGYDTNDGDKCTAVRAIQSGEAQLVERPPPRCILLDPTVERCLGPSDMNRLAENGVCLIDTPWYLLPETSIALERAGGDWIARRLTMPPQRNAYYQGSQRVSTAGAMAYVCALLGAWSQAERILALFEWGFKWLDALREQLAQGGWREPRPSGALGKTDPACRSQ